MSLLVLSVAALATTLPCISLWLSESVTTSRENADTLGLAHQLGL